MRSEYDYNSKRKFTDILSKFKKNNLTGRGLKDLNYNPGVRNDIETVSRNSAKVSITSSYRNRLNAIERVGRFKPSDMPTPIDEGDEMKPLEVIDKEGKVITLTPDHIKMLKLLAHQEDIANMNAELEELLKNISW